MQCKYTKSSLNRFFVEGVILAIMIILYHLLIFISVQIYCVFTCSLFLTVNSCVTAFVLSSRLRTIPCCMEFLPDLLCADKSNYSWYNIEKISCVTGESPQIFLLSNMYTTHTKKGAPSEEVPDTLKMGL